MQAITTGFLGLGSWRHKSASSGPLVGGVSKTVVTSGTQGIGDRQLGSMAGSTMDLAISEPGLSEVTGREELSTITPRYAE